jgi:hypothetical protein
VFDPPPDKPQSVGDLVGRAFRIFRQGIPLYLKTLTGPTVLSAAGGLGIQWFAVYGISAFDNGPSSQAVFYLGAFLCSLILLLVARWVLTVRQLAYLRLASGFATDYDSAHQHVKQRQWRIMAIFFLSVAASVLILLLALVGFFLTQLLPKTGLAAMLISIGSMVSILLLFFAAYYCVWLITPIALAVLSCEKISLGSTISRSLNLVLADPWRNATFCLLLCICIGLLSYPLCLPLIGIEAADRFSKDLLTAGQDSYKLPLYLMIISGVWESLVYMLLWPVVFVAYGLFYYDLRLRQEGLDISRNLDSLSLGQAGS